MMLLHNLKVFQKPIQHHWLAIHLYNKADQILTYDCQMLIWFVVYLIATVPNILVGGQANIEKVKIGSLIEI